LEKDLFARYFFEVWDKLESAAAAATATSSSSFPAASVKSSILSSSTSENSHQMDGKSFSSIPSAASGLHTALAPASSSSNILKSDGRLAPKPSYFRYLTLMSFHVFIQEKVDFAIVEVGIGGAFDSTNIVEQPLATGITSLGMDHMAILGDTLAKIAWQKAGIFKKNCPAFSSIQKPEAVTVIKDRAIELGVSHLEFVDEKDVENLKNVSIGKRRRVAGGRIV
jgi:folylpolyglutamate synthase/dihydrofolate synthase